MVNEATSTNITGGTTPTGGTITIRDGSGSIIPNGPNTITSGGSKMATGTTIIIGATATGGLTITRNWAGDKLPVVGIEYEMAFPFQDVEYFRSGLKLLFIAPVLGFF